MARPEIVEATARMLDREIGGSGGIDIYHCRLIAEQVLAVVEAE